MASALSIDDFVISVFEGIPVIDVRSPAEFEHGHIPGSFNFPVLDNDERKTVGITYKERGREAAVIKGFELTGNKFSSLIEEIIKAAPGKKVLIYCWRGGMRSAVVSWMLELAGFKTILLKGGYKAYRKWTDKQFRQPHRLLVISGHTCSGKTELLKALAAQGEKIIDLEALANHKGSAFGSLGQNPQPTNEHFENMLAYEFYRNRNSDMVWLENESRLIGKNLIPDAVFFLMNEAPAIEVNIDITERLNRVMEEYGTFPVDLLKEKTKKIEKRLGGVRLKQALDYLSNGDLKSWAIIMLDYYDKTYEYNHGLYPRKKNFEMRSAGMDVKSLVPQLIEIKKNIINEPVESVSQQ